MVQKMERLQFYLEPDLNRDLERAAKEQGVSKAELVREGLRRVIMDKRTPKDDSLIKLIGGSRSGRKDISEQHDLYLFGLFRK